MIKLKSLILESNERLGKCYELSARYVSRHQNSVLVHGKLINPFEKGHHILDHAWVEIGNEILDPVMDKIWPKDVYESLFKVKINKKYSFKETLQMMNKYENYGPWESDISELFLLEENISYQTLINVDIQPEYEKSFGKPFLNKWINFLNKIGESTSKIVFLYNGTESLGMITEDEYKVWLYENGMDEEILNHCIFYDKGYAFFRYCMDSFLDEDIITNFVRFMYNNNVHDSREMNRNLWAKYLRENRKTDKKEIYNLLRTSSDMIYIPDLMDFLKNYNGIVLTGGGINECLKEVEIALKALEKNYSTLNEFTY